MVWDREGFGSAAAPVVGSRVGCPLYLVRAVCVCATAVCARRVSVSPLDDERPGVWACSFLAVSARGGAGGGGGPRGAHSLITHGASQVIRKLIISDEMAAPLSSFSTTDLLAECALVPINYDTPALRAHAK